MADEAGTMVQAEEIIHTRSGTSGCLTYSAQLSQKCCFSLLIKFPLSFTTILAIILTMKLTTIMVTFRKDSIF